MNEILEIRTYLEPPTTVARSTVRYGSAYTAGAVCPIPNPRCLATLAGCEPPAFGFAAGEELIVEVTVHRLVGGDLSDIRPGSLGFPSIQCI